MRRQRSRKGEGVDYGAIHRIVIRLCCQHRGDITPSELEVLLLCHSFQRYGGCFTVPQLIRSGLLVWEDALFYRLINLLQTKGYICYDPDHKRRAYQAYVYNLTFKGDLIMNYYNIQTTKCFAAIGEVPRIRRKGEAKLGRPRTRKIKRKRKKKDNP